MALERDGYSLDKFVVRLPDGMRDQVAAAADADDRSMNSLIVTAIRNELDGRARANALLDALAQAAEAKGVHMQAPDRITLVLRAPEGGTLKQVLPFALLGAHVSIGRGLAVITGASQGDMVTPALEREEFYIDEHIRMAADARRYRHLRDRECIENADNDLLVLRGDTYFTGEELDCEIDTALRLETLQQQVVLEQQP